MFPDDFLHPLKDSVFLDKMVLFSRFLPHQGVIWIGNSIVHISYQWYKPKVACIFYVHSIVLELCDFRDCIDLLLTKSSTFHNNYYKPCMNHAYVSSMHCINATSHFFDWPFPWSVFFSLELKRKPNLGLQPFDIEYIEKDIQRAPEFGPDHY